MAKGLSTIDYAAISVSFGFKGEWEVELPDSAQPIHIDGNGPMGAISGPMLKAVISALKEQGITTWPVRAGQVKDFTVANNGERYTNIELTIEGYKLLAKFVDPAFKTPADLAPKPTATVDGLNLVWETLPNEFQWFAKGTCVKVEDGDTIHVRVESIGDSLKGFIDAEKHEVIQVRFSGINTPETKEHGQAYGNKMNAIYGQKFGIDVETAYNVAKEAKEYMDQIMALAGGAVIIDLDSDSRKVGPAKEAHGRYLGMIYKLPVALDQPLPGNYCINVCKTMVSNPTKLVSDHKVPLAETDPGWNDKETRFHDIQLWATSIFSSFDKNALDAQVQKRQAEQQKLIEDERNKLKLMNSQTIRTTTDYVIKKGDTVEAIAKLNNTAPDLLAKANGLSVEVLAEKLKTEIGAIIKIPTIKEITQNLTENVDFVVRHTEAINNTLDFFLAKDDRRQLVSSYHLRIGDVQLVIPPLSIQVDRTSNLQKIKALRTKSSIITKGTASNTVITMQLYFNGLDNINGYEIEGNDGNVYYADGLRTLLAQFKKAPFLPIENEHINSVYNITSVALVNISVSTVQGFPHSLQATLTLAEFEHQAYMPQLPILQEAINFPMFRWYYQDVMNENHKGNPYRTYLAPIDKKIGLTNTFTFSLANEDQIKNREQAIKDYRFMNSPAVYDAKMQTGTTELAKLKRDGDKLRAALAQQKRYLAIRDEHARAKPPVPFPVTFTVNDPVGNDLYKLSTQLDLDGCFLAYEFLQNGSGAQDLSRPRGGIFRMQLESSSLVARMDPKYRVSSNDSLFFLPADESNPSVALLIENANAVDNKVNYDKNQWYDAKAKSIESEGFLDMVERPIDGLYVTGLQVMFENVFAAPQLQALSGPSYQYLGSQDPYIQIAFETKERSAITQLQELINEVERYAREYRYGITSGFFGVNNQLCELFGVKYVMPDNIRVSTVPGYPDRWQIEMTLVGFDKTQKKSESLEGVLGTFQDETLANRDAKQDPIARDHIVVERKMRDLEVYPDLELPTYGELNAALKGGLKFAAGLDFYHNPTGSKYVDPDFYMSTPWTYRLHTTENRGGDARTTLRDYGGVKGVVSSHSGNVFDIDQNSVDTMNTIDEYSKELRAKMYEPPGKPSTGPLPQPGLPPDATLDAWKSDQNNTYIKPTFDQWASWNGVDMANLGGVEADIYNQYDNAMKNIQNPHYVEVYALIHELVDKLWVADGYAVSQKQARSYDAYWKIGTATVTDFYRASYKYLCKFDPNQKASIVPDPEGIKLSHFEALSGDSGIPKTTADRIEGYLKSIFKQENEWRQFEPGNGGMVPSKNPGSPAVGIGQIIPGFHAKTWDEAARLCWDWRYNVKTCVSYFYDLYKRAIGSDDINIKCRPWDWAVRAYEQGNFSTFYAPGNPQLEAQYKNKLETPYYVAFMKWFEGTVYSLNWDERNGLFNSGPDSRFNGPEGLDPEIHKYRYDLDEGKASANHSAYFDPLKNLETFQASVKVEQAGGDMSGFKAGGQQQDYARAKKTAEDRNPLISALDPKQIHHDMYTDMVLYDQRGRLIRAFPTFQMFVIDEGQWMTSYRLWDNLYGYNSITSIDVYKSRKIAADTAVIQMTNVYSNLTSRRLDADYGEWQYTFWDNLFWGNPNQGILDARKELADTMMLQTGARIHLRLGYNSDATNLPVVFNGTVTEMDTQDVVTIIAQGDGLELTNTISADPGEKNMNAFGFIKEPRDLLCQLMTSKGNWFKDWLNYKFDNWIFRENPLGVQHFGTPGTTPLANVPFQWFNTDYGEGAQNIYSANGSQTFSQWLFADGKKTGYTWIEAMMPIHWSQGAEQKVLMKLGGQTIWDIAQNLAYVTPDYIAAVHPFELRSTLFFGKPYYALAYRYDSDYTWKADKKYWERTITAEIRKPYMQYHVFESNTDIINNKIKASEEGVFTNVIANYEGGTSKLMMADWDIRFDKQKTQVVQANLVHRTFGVNFFTTSKQADTFAASTVRDYMKEMYKGQLLILGDPTIKPYDMCFMSDAVNTMNGVFVVKEVAHHFSFDTGFVTSVSPDAHTVIDDKFMLAHAIWHHAQATNFVAAYLSRSLGAAAIRRVMGASSLLADKGEWVLHSLMKLGSYIPGGSENTKLFKLYLKDFADALELERKGETEAIKAAATLRKADIAKTMQQAYEAMKIEAKAWEAKGVLKVGKVGYRGVLWAAEGIVAGVKGGTTAASFVREASVALGASSLGITLLIDLGINVATEFIHELWIREKASKQCVLMIPLQYQGREFTAGINGHKGMVIGDSMGKWDEFYSGLGSWGLAGSLINLFFDGGDPQGTRRFNYTWEDLAAGNAPDGGIQQ